ncbi:hypothetical protein [Desulfovibrio sp.]
MIRRSLPALLAVLLLALPAGAQEWGETATPVSPVNLRQSRDLTSPSRDVLMPGEVVRVDFLRDGWYAVFRPAEKTRDESKAIGYARAGFFKPAPATAASARPPAPPAAGSKALPAAAQPPQAEVRPLPAPSPEASPAPMVQAPVLSESPSPAAHRATGSWGELRYADRQLAVRARRDLGSEHVRTLKAGELVKVDFLRDEWVAVFPPDAPVRDESRAIGYSKARFLLPAGKKANLAPAEPAREAPVSAPAPRTDEPRLEPAPPPAALTGQTEWGQALNTKTRVALSRGPSVHAGHARTLEPGTPVRVEPVSRDWYAVFAPSEASPDPAKVWGYARRDEIEGRTPPPAETPRTDPQAAAPVPVETPPRPAGPDLTPAPAPAAVSPAVPAKASAPATSAQPPVPKDLINPFTPRRPETPVADSTLHGFRYKILDTEEDRVGDVAVIEIKIFLDVTVLPDVENLKDFSRSIWRQKRQAGRDVVLDIFLPDMNPNGLAYAVAHFDARGELEFWLRRTMLFGTRFAP